MERVAGTVFVGITVEDGMTVLDGSIEVEAAATAVSCIGVISSVVSGERVTQAVSNTIRVIEDNTCFDLFTAACSGNSLMIV